MEGIKTWHLLAAVGALFLVWRYVNRGPAPLPMVAPSATVPYAPPPSFSAVASAAAQLVGVSGPVSAGMRGRPPAAGVTLPPPPPPPLGASSLEQPSAAGSEGAQVAAIRANVARSGAGHF